MVFKSEVVAVSTSINVDVAISAYRRGIFPWPVDEEFIFWYCPERRGVLFTNKLRLDPKARKTIKRLSKVLYRFNYNSDLELKKCAEYHRSKHGDTWLTQKMIDFYLEAQKKNHFFSVTAFHGDRCLGSVFCIKIDSYVSAETMYSAEKSGSKIALFGLTRILNGLGVKFLDIQILNAVTAKLGGEEVSKYQFQEMLRNALAEPALSLPESVELDFAVLPDLNL